MLKYLSKKVTRRGSGSKKGDKASEDDQDSTVTTEQQFEFSDANVARFSDLLEVAVRSKYSDKSSGPLSFVDDSSTDNLAACFVNGSVTKSQLESYTPSVLWSAAIQILKTSKAVLGEDKCNTLRSANYDDVAQLARSLPSHTQKLIGILCASAEMMIREEPACAPMVLNSLSNSIISSLPLNSFVTTNALVNLIVDHRALFPSCHTFARKISTTFQPISPQEWRGLANNSVSVYGATSSNAEAGRMSVNTNSEQGEGDGDGWESDGSQAKRGHIPNTADMPRPAGPNTDRFSVAAAQGRGAHAISDGVGGGVGGGAGGGKPWRTAYTEDLPLNDVNASASIDVSSRFGLKPSSEPKITGAHQHHSTNPSQANPNPANPSSNPSTIPKEGALTLKDLQGVFGSSLVSAASLDFLSVRSVADEDYADTKTLSSTVKWILQSQELSETVGNNRSSSNNKGIISWSEFVRLADPYLRTPDRAYARTNRTTYKQNLPALPANTDPADSPVESHTRAGGKQTAQVAEAKHTGSSVSASQQLKDSRNRSRKGFDDVSDEEDADPSDEDRDEVSHAQQRGAQRYSSVAGAHAHITNPTTSANKGAQSKHSWDGARGSVDSSTDSAKGNTLSYRATGRFNTEDTHTQDEDEDLEEMELTEDRNPRGVNTSHTSHTSHASNASRSSAEAPAHRWTSAADRAAQSTTQSTSRSTSSLNKNIKARRQWDDDDVPTLDDDISITSGAKDREPPVQAVRRVSGNGGAVVSRSQSQGQGQGQKGSVFDLDLLDDSVASIPLMNDRSMVEEREEGKRGSERGSERGRVERDLPMHNSFDDDDDESEPEDSPIPRGGARAAPSAVRTSGVVGSKGRPLSSSFVSDSDTDVSMKVPSGKAQQQHLERQAAQHQRQANQSLLSNSFDDEDSASEPSRSPPVSRLAGAGAQRGTHRAGEVQDFDAPSVDVSRLSMGSAAESHAHSQYTEGEGGLDGAPAVKKKTGVKKFMKNMFSLTSASASSKASSTNNSQASGSVNGSPLRHRSDTAGSLDSASTLNDQTVDNTSLNAGAPKPTKSMFGRIKSKVSKPFKAGKHDGDSETGSQVSTADQAAIVAESRSHATSAASGNGFDSQSRPRVDSINSTGTAEENSQYGDLSSQPGKVKKGMLGRISSKMSKPFKHKSDTASDAGSQISTADQASLTAEAAGMPSTAVRSTSSGATAVPTRALSDRVTSSESYLDRPRVSSVESNDSTFAHLQAGDGSEAPAKVKKGMLGRISSKMSKPFKHKSDTGSERGSETGSQISTADHAALTAEMAVLETRSAPSRTPSTTLTPAQSALSAPSTDSAQQSAKAAVPTRKSQEFPSSSSGVTRARSADSADSANDSHMENLPGSSGGDGTFAKPKKSMLGRITSKMSKPFKTKSQGGSQAGSDAGSDMGGSQYSADDHVGVTTADTLRVSRDAVSSNTAPVTADPPAIHRSTPITAATLSQSQVQSHNLHQSQPHRYQDATSEVDSPPVRPRTDSLGSSSTHDHTGKPKLKKGVFGRITSKLSKPFKAGKTSSRDGGEGEGEGSEVGSQVSTEDHAAQARDFVEHANYERSVPVPAPVPTLAPVPVSVPDRAPVVASNAGEDGRRGMALADPRASAASFGARDSSPASISPPTMRSVDLDSPYSGAGGSSGRYSVGIADSVRSSGADSVPLYQSSAETPLAQTPVVPLTTAAVAANTRLPPTPRSARAASDAASEEGSVRSGTSQSSTGSKKGKPTLKGMVHKSYKVVFQGGGKSKHSEDGAAEGADGERLSLDSAGRGSLVSVPTDTPTQKVEPPAKPAKTPFWGRKKSAESHLDEPTAAPVTAAGATKPISPPKPKKPSSLQAQQLSYASVVSGGTHDHVRDSAHHNAVPQPTSPTIYSAPPAVSHFSIQNPDTAAGADSGRPLPPLPAAASSSPANTITPAGGSELDVIAADRRLSNPALKKRSSFSLSGMFGFGGSSSKQGSRNSSRAPSRSNSFTEGDGNHGLSTTAAARQSLTPRPSSVRDDNAPHKPTNGTGLAALLRGSAVYRNDSFGNTTPHSPYVGTPMSPLTPLTPALGSGSVRVNNTEQQDSAALEISAVMAESSRLASAGVLDRLQQSTRYMPGTSHKPNVLEDLEKIKRNRAAAKEGRGRSDSLSDVSSPAQRKLMVDWKTIISRRQPQSMYLSAENLAQMRRQASGDDVRPDLIAIDDADEEAVHRKKRRQMSTVADPLFGLSLHDKAALSHLRLSKSLKHSNRALPGSLSLKPVNAADLTSAQLNKLVEENVFYSELELALGAKFSGNLSRVVSRFWRQRYFVLMVEPLINPNLFPQNGLQQEKDSPLSLPSPLSPSGGVTGDSPQHATPAGTTPAAGPESIRRTESKINLTTTAEGPVPGEYRYFLLEYERGVASRWGTVPVRLVRRYPAEHILSLRTDPRAHKKGLEFTIVLRRNPLTAEETAEPKTPAPLVGGAVSMQDFPSPVDSPVDTPATDSAGAGAVGGGGLKGAVKKAQPGSRFADVVKAEQKAQKVPAVVTAPVQPSPVPTTAAAATTTVAPAVAEAPVVETRWNRVLLRHAEKEKAKEKLAAEAIAAATATVPAEGEEEKDGEGPSIKATPATTGETKPSDVAYVDEGSSDEEEGEEEDGEGDGDGDSRADAATSIGDGEGSELGLGDHYYYRQGTFDGLSEAEMKRQVRNNKKDFIKLKLKAPTPDERLQWVQIIHSVAGPTMYINTTSY